MSKLQIEFISNGYCSPGEDKVYHFFPITGTAGDIYNLSRFNHTYHPNEKGNALQEAISFVSKVLGTWNAKIVATNGQDDNTTFQNIKVTIGVKEDDVVGEDMASVPNLSSGKTLVLWDRAVEFKVKEEHSLELKIASTANGVAKTEDIQRFAVKAIPLELLCQSIITIQKTLSNPTAAVQWQEFFYQNCMGKADDNIYEIDRKVQEFADILMN